MVNLLYDFVFDIHFHFGCWCIRRWETITAVFSGDISMFHFGHQTVMISFVFSIAISENSSRFLLYNSVIISNF